MRRPLALTVAVSGLLMAAAVPLLGSASGAACPSWPDAKGDAAFAVLPDDSVDITFVNVDASATALTATFTVPALSTVNDFAPGDRFQLKMDAGGAALSIFGDRDDVDYQATTGSVAGANGPAGQKFGGTVKHDVAGKKVVVTVPYTTLDAALGKKFAGTAVKSLVGGAYVHFGPMSSNAFDEAPAPATMTLVGGQECGGSGGPAPAPAPTTSPSPKPSPTATPSATPSPSSSPTPAPTSTATPPANPLPAGLPRAGCFHVVDPAGDAKLNAQLANDPDLDITGMTLRSSGTWLLTYLKVDKLAAGPAISDGHRFTIEFVFNKHLFTVAASNYKTEASEDIREGLAATGKNGHMVQMSVDTVSTISAATAEAYVAGQVSPPYRDSGSLASFDTKNGYVVIGIPIADIEKYGQAKFTGATAVTGKSSADFWRNSLGADTTAKDNVAASTDAWTLGDNKCFPQPVATALSLSVAKKANTRTVTARLTSAGKPLAGQVVTWLVNGRKVGTATTSSAGTAVLKTAKPTQTVTVEFAGVADKYLASRTSARV